MENFNIINLINKCQEMTGFKTLANSNNMSSRYCDVKAVKKTHSVPSFLRLDSTGNTIDMEHAEPPMEPQSSQVYCSKNPINYGPKIFSKGVWRGFPHQIHRSKSSPASFYSNPCNHFPSSVISKDAKSLDDNIPHIVAGTDYLFVRDTKVDCTDNTSDTKPEHCNRLMPSTVKMKIRFQADRSGLLHPKHSADLNTTKVIKVCDNSTCDKTKPVKKSCLNDTKTNSDSGMSNQCIDSNIPSKTDKIECCSMSLPVKKKKHKSRPSKKKRIRLKIQRQILSPDSDCKKVEIENKTMPMLFVGVANYSVQKEDPENEPQTHMQDNVGRCKFSFFLSGADSESSECETSDYGDWSDDDDSGDPIVWSDISIPNSGLNFVCGLPYIGANSTINIETKEDQIEESQAVKEANLRWQQSYGYFQQPLLQSDSRVSFAKDLATVNHLDDLDHNRRGPWEEMARDRQRFNDRIRKTDNDIGHVLKPSHRKFVYNKYYK